ncbi:MAG TPA: DUF2891 family protein [Bryobacteraceae bacterium]|nr:DUF2891 family protein [Bryobacteraceae bacterium]
MPDPIRMRLSLRAAAVLLIALCPTFGQPKDDDSTTRNAAFLKALPDAKLPPIDQAQALALVSLPLSCVDHPQAFPEGRADYLWVQDGKPHLTEGFEKNRIFYGCSDWHSAVHSLWALVYVAKNFPGIPIGALIRDRLKDHLGKTNVDGEIEFLKNAKRFEIPYGYAWVLKLYAELKTWNLPEAKQWSDNMAPLAQEVSKKLVQYFKDLRYPVRGGMHPNTANVSTVMLDYTDVIPDEPLRDAIVKTDNRFFGEDRTCPTAYEPAGTDFLSPCLTEARLMSRLMDKDHFAAWLNDFLPPLYSTSFKPIITPAESGEFSKDDLVGAKSHLIGLAFSRAEDLVAIANMLPSNDSRVPVLRRLAAINASVGFERIGNAGYEGSHWFATYALLYGHALSAGK